MPLKLKESKINNHRFLIVFVIFVISLELLYKTILMQARPYHLSLKYFWNLVSQTVDKKAKQINITWVGRITKVI